MDTISGVFLSFSLNFLKYFNDREKERKLWKNENKTMNTYTKANITKNREKRKFQPKIKSNMNT